MINEMDQLYVHDDSEWQRKTCQHLIRLIKDEQLLLNESLHPKVVEDTLHVIDMLLKSVQKE